MRIISGESRGRILKAPQGQRVRPTAGKIKEALFNILGSRILGARVLDLFSGTGAVGIEALSRGAASVDFVEQDPGSFRVLTENVRSCGYQSNCRLYRQPVLLFLKKNGSRKAFDIVFADPPYHTSIIKKLLPQLDRGVKMQSSGLIIIEHFHKTSLPDRIGSHGHIQSRRYGDSILSFYQLN